MTARRNAFSRSQKPRRGFVLMEGDRKAVEDVGRYRFLTAKQLLQLHWPKPGQRRHGESRLRELFHAGWLERQPFGVGLGHPFAVYSLGPLGRLHVSEQTGVAVGKLGPRPVKERNHDLLFLRHHLETVQVVINLDAAAQRHGGGLVHYREERALRAEAIKSRTKVVPDAFVVLAIGPLVQSFCLELDRATVDALSWRGRLRDYFAWSRSQHFLTELHHPAALVVVQATPNVAQRRMLELQTLINEEARREKADASLFWLTTQDLATPRALLDDAIWLVGGRGGLHRLLRE